MENETIVKNENSAATTETPVKSEKKAKKVLGIIGNILMWIFIAFSIVITIFAFSAQSSADGIPSVGGKVISPVLTDSMAPTFKAGDIIISRKISSEQKASLEVGNIITFKADLDGNGTPEINTHRIVSIVETEDGTVTGYKTKGDNNIAGDSYTVYLTDIISVFDENKDTRIPVLGSVINFLLQPTGFFIVIVIPLILFFLFEIIMFVKKIMEVKNAGKKQITEADEELIKQKAIEEYLRSQQAQQALEQAQQETQQTEEPAESTSENAE